MPDKKTSSSSSSFHPALAVSNIRNHISVTLGMDNDQYPLWVALFTNHAKSTRVLHHIIPSKGKSISPSPEDDKEQWETIDATVLQWIYATVTNDLLETIVEENSTAKECWDRLKNIFHDNQHSRAVTLEQEFSHISMEDFSTVSAYCQRLKSIADQLKNVGSPVSESRLVLQLVSGLSSAYSGVGTIIRQSNPLPPFYRARSMLTLEEAGLAKQAATGAPSAMLAKTATSGESILGRPPATTQSKSNKSWNKKKGGNKGGKGNNGGKGGSAGGNDSGQTSSPPTTAPGSPWAGGYAPWQWTQPPWGFPPCPYPTTPWTRPAAPRQFTAPRPQAYSAESPPSQTDIEQAMYTLGLTPPDARWFMDTGATSHMTSDAGNLSSYVNKSIKNGILVGNGQSIPIHGTGSTTLPKTNPQLHLNHVLHVPKLVKNLVSVRKFTTDNSVSVEFDPFGFVVKDYMTGTRLMRCDSRGELYPVTSAKTAIPHASFAAIAPSLWHDRLGHPGAPVFNSLK
ncbi:uncharacterized protein LOC141588536 [Silene latifolia]|uniref:uncharacterized protein LOC141588536 n=1 Tax=Silene latifolia TaxID=37657 RepID=UPI003D76D68A